MNVYDWLSQIPEIEAKHWSQKNDYQTISVWAPTRGVFGFALNTALVALSVVLYERQKIRCGKSFSRERKQILFVDSPNCSSQDLGRRLRLAFLTHWRLRFSKFSCSCINRKSSSLAHGQS